MAFWLLAPVLVGVVVGRLRGGRLRGLGELRLRAGWVPITLFGVQLLGGGLDEAARQSAVAVTYVGLAVWLAWNLRFVGRAALGGGVLFGVGLVMNTVPILANGFMPVSVPALRRAGLPSAVQEFEAVAKHETIVDGTVAAWLGDTIAVPWSFARAVVSPGDLVLWLGVAVAVSGLMLAHRAGPPAVLFTARTGFRVTA